MPVIFHIADQKVVRVLDVKFYQSLCSLLAAKPVGYWDHYLKWNFLDPLIGHLGKDFQHADLLFRFVGCRNFLLWCVSVCCMLSSDSLYASEKRCMV